jgi:hypothetical protein
VIYSPGNSRLIYMGSYIHICKILLSCLFCFVSFFIAPQNSAPALLGYVGHHYLHVLYRRLKSDQHESTDYSGELQKVKRFMLLKGEHFLLHWHLQRSECTQCIVDHYLVFFHLICFVLFFVLWLFLLGLLPPEIRAWFTWVVIYIYVKFYYLVFFVLFRFCLCWISLKSHGNRYGMDRCLYFGKIGVFKFVPGYKKSKGAAK